jgi:TonB family protein
MFLFATTFLFLTGANLLAAPRDSAVPSADEIRPDLIYAPRPVYPREAQFRSVQGIGIYKAQVNGETGKVAAVAVVKTAGYRLLDNAVIDALKRWRLKPHSVAAFYYRFGFVPELDMGGGLAEAQRYATYSPMPQAPLQARADIQSPIRGEYQLLIDPKTGRVTDVKIAISSHSSLLDQVARTAFLQWRFIPHTVSSVTVPLEAYPIWHR